MRSRTAAALLAVCTGAFIRGAEDPKEIVRRAIQFNTQNDEVARNYTFLRRQETRTYDGSGAVKHRESKTWDVTLLEGSPYSRLIQRDDKQLPPAEEKQQQENLAKSNDLRRKETPAERQERIQAWERNRKRQQEELKEVPDAFDFRLIGEDQVDGIRTWVIEGTPHPGYKPKSRASTYFTKMKGRIWVAQSDYQPVKMEAETIDSISVGAFLVRLAKGAHVKVEYARVNGEVWLPKFIGLTGSARIVLVKGMRLDTDIAYSNYKKFTTDSRVVELDNPTPAH